MPIIRLLENSQLPPERKHTLQLAFNHALRKLGLVDRNDPLCEMVAHKVIEIGSSGATNAIAIAETAYRQLGPGASPVDK